MTELIKLDNVVKYFPLRKGLFQKGQVFLKAVDGVSFSINERETFGLVGESGCGKTTVAKLILLLEQLTSGTISFEGKEVHKLSGEGLREFRRSVHAVFQDPFSSLNPRMRVGTILSEPLRVHHASSGNNIRERVSELLEIVGLPPESTDRYPHEFSGGQRQRIAVARSLALNPRLLVLDEPVSALDVSIRAQILNLLVNLQKRLGLTYLIIAHDLAVVGHMSTNTGIMYLGKIVELGASEEVYGNPLHPYSKALMATVPRPDPSYHPESILTGEVPSPVNPPPGCHFHTRCSNTSGICSREEPPMVKLSPNHYVACHRVT